MTSFDKQYSFLKDRATKLDVNESVDEGFRDYISLVNSRKDLATVWCCTGHERDDYYNYTLPYLALVSVDSNKTALDLCFHLSKEWERLYAERYHTPLSVEYIQLYTDPAYNIGVYYPCVTLRLINRAPREEGGFPSQHSVEDYAWKFIQERFFKFLMEETKEYFSKLDAFNGLLIRKLS